MSSSSDGQGGKRTAEIDLATTVETRGRGVRTLGPVLVWAIAFADIGTSVYYVPGILFGQVGGRAAAYVLITTVAFVLVALEHMEVAYRYPAGGGGVSAAVEALGRRVGLVSGSLMISAYLIAIGIAVVTAMHYLATIFPAWPPAVLLASVAAILVLGVSSWLRVRATARLTLFAAIAALLAHGWLLVAVMRRFQPADWTHLFTNVRHLGQIDWTDLATGFASAWLAYSGLESLGQMAPSVREPRRRVIRIATWLVVGSVLITVPIFTAVAVEAATASHIAPENALLAAVARNYGGRDLQIAVVVTGALLLLLAARVAFVGCYQVFQALGEHGYLPAAIAKSHSPEEAPRGAALVVTLGAMVLVIASRGDPRILAQLFAFGLLGSYTITSISLDVLRWREHRRGLLFLFGLVATLAVAAPWVISWFTKWRATAYGAGATALLLGVALVTRRGWIRSGRFGFLSASAAEESAADLSTAVEVLTMSEALAVRQSYPSTTMVALRSGNPGLCREAARRAKGMGDAAVYVIFVDEIPGFLFPPRRGPSAEALRVLRRAAEELRAAGIDAVPIWRLAHDAGASLAEAAEQLGIRCVFIGTNQRASIWHFLQGGVLQELVKELPDDVRVVICE